MKNIFFSAIALFLVAITGCNKDDDNLPSISPSNVSSTVVSGTWRITYYFDTDHEATSNFTGFKFTFGANGTLSATNDILTRTGTWATGTDDSKTKLVLTFATPAEFENISEDWEVIERTDTKIRLQHVSGGNGGTDLLTFEKN